MVGGFREIREVTECREMKWISLFVWEQNYQLTAWWRHIYKHHSMDKDWHISVDYIVVDPRNCTAVFVNAMNDINW